MLGTDVGRLVGWRDDQPEHERLDGVINTMTMVVIDPAQLAIRTGSREVPAMANYTKAPNRRTRTNRCWYPVTPNVSPAPGVVPMAS